MNVGNATTRSACRARERMNTSAQIDRLYEEAIRCKETAQRLLKNRCYPLAFAYSQKGLKLADEAIKLCEYK